MPADPYIGTILPFAGNFAPKGWLFCNGQLLQIQPNVVLFALIGTYYGGDGVNTFALPDLRGRCAISFGFRSGLTPRPLAQSFGSESVSLLVNQIPSHTHTLRVVPVEGTTSNPANGLLAKSASDTRRYASPGAAAAMSSNLLGAAGANQPHNNMQPSLTMSYIIALQGLFPPRP